MHVSISIKLSTIAIVRIIIDIIIDITYRGPTI